MPAMPDTSVTTVKHRTIPASLGLSMYLVGNQELRDEEEAVFFFFLILQGIPTCPLLSTHAHRERSGVSPSSYKDISTIGLGPYLYDLI